MAEQPVPGPVNAAAGMEAFVPAAIVVGHAGGGCFIGGGCFTGSGIGSGGRSRTIASCAWKASGMIAIAAFQAPGAAMAKVSRQWLLGVHQHKEVQKLPSATAIPTLALLYCYF